MSRHTWSHTPKMLVSIWTNFWWLCEGKKSTSSFKFSLRYYKDIVNLLFWVHWACLGYAHPKWYYQLVENFCLYLHVKNQVHPPSFSEILRRCANFLFWVHWACLTSHTQNDNVYLHNKNKLYHSLLSWDIIPQFDWPTAFWTITWEPKFCQIWRWCETSNKKNSFHFRLFPGKTGDKIFQKIPKNLFWDQFQPFMDKFGQRIFSLKKGLCQILNIPIIYHRAKNQKKLMTHSWQNGWTDIPRDRQTGRQTDNRQQTTVIL